MPDAIALYYAKTNMVKLRLDKLAGGNRLVARWTNPATGEERSASSVERRARSFTPPAGWQDALLYVAARKQTSN